MSGGGRGSQAPSTAPNPVDTHRPLSQQEAQDALLTVGEIGGGFEQQTSTDNTNALPCAQNEPPLDKQFSPTAKAQADFGLPSNKALVSEEIVVYADERTALAALHKGEQGLSCSTTKIPAGGRMMTVRLSGPMDLRGDLGVDLAVDSCEGWSVSSEGISLVLIVARVGPQLVVLSFTAQKDVDTTTLPSSRALTSKALAKVDAML